MLSYYQIITKKIALVNIYDSLNLEPDSQVLVKFALY